MQIRNPCKKCLVQPICRSACEYWYSYKYTQSKLKDWMSYVILLMVGLEMVVWYMGEFKAPQAGIIAGVLFASSITQAWLIRNYRKIIKHTNQRFNQGIGTRINLKPKPSSRSSSVGRSAK